VAATRLHQYVEWHGTSALILLLLSGSYLAVVGQTACVRLHSVQNYISIYGRNKLRLVLMDARMRKFKLGNGESNVTLNS